MTLCKQLDFDHTACFTLFRVKATQSSRWMAVFYENLDCRVKLNCQAPIVYPSSWCPTRKLGFSWKRWSSVLRRWSWPLRHAPQPVCVSRLELSSLQRRGRRVLRNSKLSRILGALQLHHWFHCQPTPPGCGHHRNDAIRRNMFALFVSMCIRTATFIVGKPNTSSPCSCHWTCSQVRWLQLKQQKLSFQKHGGVLVLLPQNSLMSLHSPLDRASNTVHFRRSIELRRMDTL